MKSQESAIKNLDKLNSETSASLIERFGKSLSVNESQLLDFLAALLKKKSAALAPEMCIRFRGSESLP